MGNGESHFICDILFFAECSFTEFMNFVREQVDNGKQGLWMKGEVWYGMLVVRFVEGKFCFVTRLL